jgi:hypothetical protein
MLLGISSELSLRFYSYRHTTCHDLKRAGNPAVERGSASPAIDSTVSSHHPSLAWRFKMRTFSHRAHASARFLILRSATTASAFPPRIPVAPTTFSAKSSPREVHERPEVLRGLSPTSKISSPHGGQISPSQATIDAFEGPSRPRLLNDRTGRRDLPPLKVR